MINTIINVTAAAASIAIGTALVSATKVTVNKKPVNLNVVKTVGTVGIVAGVVSIGCIAVDLFSDKN